MSFRGERELKWNKLSNLCYISTGENACISGITAVLTKRLIERENGGEWSRFVILSTLEWPLHRYQHRNDVVYIGFYHFAFQL
jgi:hypothetical protein